jgi:hypothetical protein
MPAHRFDLPIFRPTWAALWMIIGCSDKSDGKGDDGAGEDGTGEDGGGDATGGDGTGSEPYTGEVVPFLQPPFRDTWVAISTPHDVEWWNRHLFVAAGNEGLVVVDAQEPWSLERVATLALDGPAYGIAVADGFAYVVVDSFGLAVIDVADPADPVQVGSYPSTSLRGIALVEDRAYLSSESDPYFEVLDISDPSTPTSISSLEGTDSDAYDAIVIGSYAYLANGSEGLRTIDLSDESSPVEAIDDYAYGFGSYKAIEGMGDRLIVGTSDELILYDLANPAAPARLSPDINTDPLYDVAVRGDVVYTATGNAGAQGAFQAYDFSTYPELPSVWTRTLPNYTWYLATDDRHAYVAVDGCCGEVLNGIYVFSLDEQPPEPVFDAALETDNTFDLLDVSGETAFAAGTQGLWRIDLTDPKTPHVTGTQPGYMTDLDAEGDLVFVAASGLAILDGTSDDASPLYEGPLDAQAVAARGDQLVIVDPSAALAVLDVSDPTAPIEVGHYDGSFVDVSVTEGQAWGSQYLDSYQFEVLALDLTDPSSPGLMAAEPLSHACLGGDLSIGDTVGIVVCGEYGALLLDADAEDVATLFRGAVPTYGVPSQARMVGDVVWIADGEVGLTLADGAHPAGAAVSGQWRVPAGSHVYEVAPLGALALILDSAALRVLDPPMVALAESYATGSPGETLTYTATWTDAYEAWNEGATCRPTGGVCAIESIDQAAHSARVTWTLPPESGDFELAVAVGNLQYFVVARDRVHLD